jgi:hypothetical protein
VVESTSRPWLSQLEKLLQPTACRIIPCRVLPGEFSKQITEDGAHFGVRVWSDGECWAFFDEQGRQVEVFAKVNNAAVPPDAMAAMVLLLNLLSRDDRSCSAALDEGEFEK